VATSTNGLPSGKSVTRPTELNITFKPQYKSNRTPKREEELWRESG